MLHGNLSCNPYWCLPQGIPNWPVMGMVARHVTIDGSASQQRKRQGIPVMSSDLEKFLQQAAERLAQKLKQAGQSTSPSGGKPSGTKARASVRSQPSSAASPSLAQRRPPPVVEIIEAEVMEDPQKRKLREAGSDPLSTIDTRPALAQSIDQTDERLDSHLHQVFDHDLTHLRKASSSLAPSASTTDRATEVVTRATATSPLLATLRNPETLRAAFIVGEIFRRKT